MVVWTEGPCGAVPCAHPSSWEHVIGNQSDYRFDRAVVPSHYQIVLEPDIGGASFVGSEVVDFVLTEVTDSIVLNSVELDIHEATIKGPGVESAATIVYDEDLERVSLTLSQTLEPGDYQLVATFSGILNDKLHGFYLSKYTDADGIERTMATSQLQATDARRAFPCWDQPDLKATFGVTLIVEDGHMAITNGPEIGRTALDGGKAEIRFGTTMKMSTYLVAFIVGELEASETVDVDGTPLRVIHVPGKASLAAFALEAGAFCLRYFADYYGIPYPGKKLDMLAIPDFSAGAMENLGAITYRETALLVDPNTATHAELDRVAEVVAHELAHMWFGDLVTMGWWEGVWLNEAFATFMENKAVEAFKPEWNRWLGFATSRQSALEIDALRTTRPIELAVASPEEADAMFDTLTYEKGGAVLRMLEQYLGEEVFRAGISAYLVKHSYANTVTSDLWDALEEVSGEPVAEMMDGWIYQGGYPRLNAAEAEDGTVELTQDHYRFLGGGEGRWMVPLRYRSSEGDGRMIVRETAVLDPGDDVLLNAGGDGFYSVRYDADLMAGIRSRLSSLTSHERSAVVWDTWSGVLAGDTSGSAFLELVAALDAEREPAIWAVALGGVAELDNVVSSDLRSDLQSFVRSVLGSLASELGWEVSVGDAALTRQLRGVVLRGMGALGDDDETKRIARDIVAAGGSDPRSRDGDVASAALHIAATSGTLADFDAFLEAYCDASTPQEAIRYLRAAATVPDDVAAARLLTMVVDGTIRRQDSYWLLATMLGQRQTGAATWERIKAQWDTVLAAMPKQNIRRMFDRVQNRSEPEVAKDIKAWIADHPLGAASTLIAQQMERLDVRVGLRSREATSLKVPGL
ncbi:aminopeptidase N [bacterium BMS3Bbin02]|nr:aminopeptidase N [bacterium BMS3Bbin02]